MSRLGLMFQLHREKYSQKRLELANSFEGNETILRLMARPKAEDIVLHILIYKAAIKMPVVTN